MDSRRMFFRSFLILDDSESRLGGGDVPTKNSWVVNGNSRFPEPCQTRLPRATSRSQEMRAFKASSFPLRLFAFVIERAGTACSPGGTRIGLRTWASESRKNGGGS